MRPEARRDGASLEPRASSLDRLVAEVQRATQAQGRRCRSAPTSRLAAYRARLGGARELVLAADVAVELGSPRRRSAHAVLWSTAAGAVADGRIVVIGPDLGAPAPPAPRDRAYVQLVLLEVDQAGGEGSSLQPPASSLLLEAPQLLIRRLPGLQARALPGRLWLRASRDAIDAGLDFALVGAALGEAYRALPGVRGVECVFASGADADVAAFAALAAEASVITGRHHRLSLGADGAFECLELDCAACDERPVCDRLRAAVAIRRRAAAPRPAAGGAR